MAWASVGWVPAHSMAMSAPRPLEESATTCSACSGVAVALAPKLSARSRFHARAGHRDDVLDTPVAQQLDVQQPAHAQADHDRRIAWRDAQPGLRVHAGGQHLEQGRVGGGQAVRQRVQARLVHRDQFGEDAVHIPAEQGAAAAQVGQVTAAQVAPAAEQGRVDQDRSPRGHGPRWPWGLHPAGHLVAQHPGP